MTLVAFFKELFWGHWLLYYDISNITVNGVFTKLFADDLKLYTSLISTDDSHNLQDVQSSCTVFGIVKSQCQ